MAQSPQDDSAQGDSIRPKVKHRPSWIAFVVLGSIVCIGMGVWQLARYKAAAGTVQNLGYTFMWPFLAGFLVYAYSKYIRLEADEVADDDASSGSPAGRGTVSIAAGGVDGEDSDDDGEDHIRPNQSSATGTARRRRAQPTEIPADILPVRRAPAAAPIQDEGLNAYNSYLTELARQDARSTEVSPFIKRPADDRSQEELDT